MHLLREHHMNVIPLWACQEGCACRDHVCYKVR